MTDLSPLYQIEFEFEKATEDHIEGGLCHVVADIRPACHTAVETSRYSYGDLLDAWRWHAGLLSRVGMHLLDYTDETREAHGCKGRRDMYSHCFKLCVDRGWLLAPHRLVERRPNIPALKEPGMWQDYPYLSLVVPGEPEWIDRVTGFFTRSVEAALADDQLPAPQPEEHAGLVLTDDPGTRASTTEQEQQR